MATRTELHNVGRNAGDVGASTSRGSASSRSSSLTNLKIAYLAPERLHPSRTTPARIPRKQLKQIARSIERLDFVNPVLIYDDFEIIAGHGRVEAAKILGLKQVRRFVYPISPGRSARLRHS